MIIPDLFSFLLADTSNKSQTEMTCGCCVRLILHMHARLCMCVCMHACTYICRQY